MTLIPPNGLPATPVHHIVIGCFMFDEQYEEPRAEMELEDKFREIMQNNVAVRHGYDSAKSFGLNEEMRLKATVIVVAELNKRAQAIITEAIMHGMPITEEVADVRNQIVGATSR
ncbi:hypothetical protein [Rubripirellula reticaptiva]|uniref:hypothetical protein n=1 Tax=Rubripirellula reticaptiva TaxID=2528013 RepID=UPI0011B4B8A4|nr:hypothetical protein [Rubripirellula reticaptiva]